VLLENKTAIVYGAGGAIGSAVARAYAREGAHVHLAGRTNARLQAVAEVIRTAGGQVHPAQLDVLDQLAVRRHISTVAETSGTIDVCFNATSNDDVQGTTILELPFNLPPGGLIPRHQPSLDEVADIATYLASDSARTITAAEINLTGGAVID